MVTGDFNTYIGLLNQAGKYSYDYTWFESSAANKKINKTNNATKKQWVETMKAYGLLVLTGEIPRRFGLINKNGKDAIDLAVVILIVLKQFQNL